MKQKIFKYKLVYYLAVITSLLLFIISAFLVLEIFNDFSLLKTLFIGISLVINSFAFVNLVEKYDKAILFLNLSLFLSIMSLGYPLLLGFLNGYYIVGHFTFKFLIVLILSLLIVNLFKVKRYKGVNEIENIGKHED
ncbi:hypothetical protein [Chryseobacterium sediminis]|jgi:hypothetical protein|uniref:hypothetical protein n=1 Tax=Chryseobacterium sediminis TaxID=1679494 RepID=UPI002866200D|nr:hypothetical protein [Chryseobacterium sediminis]MDR6465254.1 putative neutral ceramidase superfamily lipid hydrolase [Chryseobacterium sediminis]